MYSATIVWQDSCAGAMFAEPEPPYLAPGDFYEDCRWHPMVCVEVAEDRDELIGISLVTGDVGACSLNHCGVVRRSPRDAIDRRLNWDRFVEERGLTGNSSSHYPRGDPRRE